MSPILGIFASSTPSVGDYESIATTTVGAGGASSISFTSISGTYKHLQLRAITGVSSSARYGISFNSDTTLSNYNQHSVYGTGSAAAAFYAANYWGIGAASAGTAFGAAVVDVLDYSNSNKNKVWRSLTGQDVNGSGGLILLVSGLWRNTAAITSITVYPAEDSTGAGSSFQQYSSFALYGIK